MNMQNDPASFRDPSGFIFHRDGIAYRQIKLAYKKSYDCLISSGLYERLVQDSFLIEHNEVDNSASACSDSYKVIKPKQLPFISYPYEWCFSELKSAALLTLKIQKTALQYGMCLKDASAYNVQFMGIRPIFIDTLSLDIYEDGQPWVGYRQFCQHFLAPLALMSKCDIRLAQLLKTNIDGIPLDLASQLLPFHARFNLPFLLHLFLHAGAQHANPKKNLASPNRTFSKQSLLGLIDNLEWAINSCRMRNLSSIWNNYYNECTYSSQALQHKAQLLEQFINAAKPRMIWDMGANIGHFSKIACQRSNHVISYDFDPHSIELFYNELSKQSINNILPLVMDVTNPSAALGWRNRERMSMNQRGPADMAIALALIHHLAIANNIPLNDIAEFFASICRWLVIEFVPKTDSQVDKLLASRKDIFETYTQEHFETEFQRLFTIQQARDIPDTQRRMYLMAKK